MVKVYRANPDGTDSIAPPEEYPDATEMQEYGGGNLRVKIGQFTTVALYPRGTWVKAIRDTESLSR